MVAVAGKEFSDSGNILGLLIIAVAFIFLGTMFSHAVIAINKQRKLIGYYVFTSVTAIIGYMVLIPKFSSTGAAIVTIYSDAIIAIFSAYCVYKYSRFIPKINILLKSIIASFMMGFFIYLYPSQFKFGFINLIILIVLASLVYGLFLFLLGGINIQDFKMLLKKSKVNQTYKPINPV